MENGAESVAGWAITSWLAARHDDAAWACPHSTPLGEMLKKETQKVNGGHALLSYRLPPSQLRVGHWQEEAKTSMSSRGRPSAPNQVESKPASSKTKT